MKWLKSLFGQNRNDIETRLYVNQQQLFHLKGVRKGVQTNQYTVEFAKRLDRQIVQKEEEARDLQRQLIS